MADERRRVQERQARSGTLDDRARLLVVRVRQGEPGRDELELAAYLGDSAAGLAAAEVCRQARRNAEAALLPVHGWRRGLVRWGKPVTVRAALVIAELEGRPETA